MDLSSFYNIEMTLIFMFSLLILIIWSNVATDLIERLIEVSGVNKTLTNLILLVILSGILFFILYNFSKRGITEPL